MAEQQKRIAAYQAVVTQAEEIEEGYRRLVAARELDRNLSQHLLEQEGIQRHLREYDRAISQSRGAVEADLQNLRRRWAELLRQSEPLEGMGAALEDARTDVQRLEARRVERERLAVEQAALRESRAELEATNRGLRNEMAALNHDRNQIATAPEAVCPLCQQPLSDAHRTDLLARLEQEGAEKAEQYRANQQEMAELKNEIERREHEIARADSELRNLPPRQAQIAELTEKIRQAEEAKNEYVETASEVVRLEEILATETYAPEARAAYQELARELAELGYDEAAHQEARLTLDTCAVYQERKAELDQVLKSLPDAESYYARLADRIASRTSQGAEDQDRLGQLQEETAGLADRLAELEPWEAELDRLQIEERQASNRLGRAQQQIIALNQQRERRNLLLAQRDQYAEEYGIYEELRAAFSKDGIPAMLIEAAIPEIEGEANEILTRMTDGRMHTRFETQREKVTGGIKETLDIRIADELGTRDYETFSGGEAYRVNFAIRLALSRLLARRAGAQLRTLIIDEGFGTQDAQGRERLVQAITTIKDDFDLILVITHIDELKDAFPVRIEITKTPAGSVIELN
jgi:exonuclease SbcC